LSPDSGLSPAAVQGGVTGLIVVVRGPESDVFPAPAVGRATGDPENRDRTA